MLKPLWANCVAQVQHWGDTCGITSCAVAINALMGKHLTDRDLKASYGYGLLEALNEECASKYHWEDTGNFSPSCWASIEHNAVNGFPTIAGRNGEFSETGRGHIICIFKVEGDQVTFTDSSEGPSGHIRTVSKARFEAGSGYPGGDFLFTCTKLK